jgi:mRNA-degrading endonuclease RelE of RelBE toxin-antitoxin system
VTYRVQVARSAARQLTEQLPEALAAACVEFLYGPLAENPHRVGAPLRKPFEGYWRGENPHRVGAPLRKPFEGYWRARRGEYRVRYTIDDNTHTVQVLDISHRRDAYH